LLRAHSCKLIFVMREEYIAHLYDFEKIVPEIFRKRIRVEAMSNRNVMRVIEGTTSYYQIDVEETEKTVNQIIENISENKAGVQLAYLQVYLDRLYRAASHENTTKVAFDSTLVKKIGSLGDVLSVFIEEQAFEIQNLVNEELKVNTKEDVWDILKELVTLEGTKKPIKYKELIKNSEKEISLAKRIIELLENSRIVRIIDHVCEVSHDTLAIKIAEKFSTEERNLLRMEKLVKDSYDRNKQTRTFLSSEDLEYIKPYENKLRLSILELDFLEKSHLKVQEQLLKEKQAQDEKIRKQKLLNRIIILAAVFSLLFSIVATYLYFDAKKAKDNAENQTKIAEKNEKKAKIQEQIANNKQREADSLLNEITVTNFNKYYEKAIDLANQKNYIASLEQLTIAKDFAKDSNLVKVDAKIKEFNETAGNEINYNKLMLEAQNLERTEANWLKVLVVYQEALALNFDNNTVQTKISTLQSNIKDRLEYYKKLYNQFKNGSPTANLKNWINPALNLCTKDQNKEYYTYFIEEKRKIEK